MTNNWDDDFASFNIDLIGTNKPEGADDILKKSSFNYDDFDLPGFSETRKEAKENAEPAPADTNEESTDLHTMIPDALPKEQQGTDRANLTDLENESVDDDEDESKEMENDMAASMAAMEEKRKQSEEKQKQLKERFPHKPKPQDPLAPAMEVLKTAEDLGLMATTIDGMKRMVNQAIESNGHHVKGVKGALRRMDDFIKVAQGAQVVVKMIANTGLPEVFETLKTSRFLSIYKSVKMTRERKEPKVLAAITDLTTALEKDDKEEATAIARQLKKHAMRLQDDAQALAEALFETTSNYPNENGQLGIFCQIAESGDTKGIENFDHAMRLTGKVVVPVGEAKTMLEARANGDQQTVEDILDRVITRLVEEEN